jgi:hypothetical protein
MMHTNLVLKKLQADQAQLAATLRAPVPTVAQRNRFTQLLTAPAGRAIDASPGATAAAQFLALKSGADTAAESILALSKVIADIPKPRTAIDISTAPQHENTANPKVTLGTEPEASYHAARRAGEVEPPPASSARSAIDQLFHDGGADRIIKSLDGFTGAITKAASNSTSSPIAEMSRNHPNHSSTGSTQLRRLMAAETDPLEYMLDKAALRAREHLANFSRSHHWTDDQFSAFRGPITERGAAVTKAEIQFGRTHTGGKPVVSPRSFDGVGKAISQVLEEAVGKAVNDAIASFLRQGYRS